VPDPPAFVRGIRDALAQVMGPAPSWELIAPDLAAARAALGAPYADAVTACAWLWHAAWQEVDAAVMGPDPGRVVSALVVAMHASVAYLDLGLLPAKRLRRDLASRLSAAAAPTGPAAQFQPPPVAPAYRFERSGELWYVRYGEEHGTFTDRKGFGYITTLLRDPWKPVPVLQLTDQGTGQALGGRTFLGAEERTPTDGEPPPYGRPSHQPVQDRTAKSQIQQRMEDLAAEIQEARENNDHGTVERLQEQFHDLAGHYQAAKGLGGRDRQLPTGDPTEEAREAVRKNLNRAYGTLEKATPPLKRLAAHLRQAILFSEGSYGYWPSPKEQPDWKF
jgi:hypothetical protein